MTSEELGDMFEGDSADKCDRKFPSRGSSVRRPGSEDPHMRDWKLYLDNDNDQ